MDSRFLIYTFTAYLLRMKHYLIYIFLLCVFGLSFAQTKTLKSVDNFNQREADTSRASRQSTSNKNIKNEEAKIDQYKIISFKNDTTFVDTTLSLKKDYKFNYLRKDNFDLISFSNIGQTYNSLSYNFHSTHSIPLFGARARHFNYIETEDVNYFHVPTPLTELFYKSAFEQGQVLDAFFTINTSEQFNFSIAYKGLRSLGKYQNILTSTGNFRFTANYKTKDRRYQARGHVVMQDLLNEENGGLQDDDIVNFESGNQEFLDRSVFDPNFENAENIVVGKRFYLEQEYKISRLKDSLSTGELSIRNIVSLENRYYQFQQSSQDDYFGNAFRSSNINDKVTLEHFYSRAKLNYRSSHLGTLGFNIDYSNYNYGYNTVVILNNQSIKNRIKGNTVALGGSYHKNFGKLEFQGELGINVAGDFEGNFFNISSTYKLNDDLTIQGELNSNSKAANYNHLLYQSDYINYNWDNSNSFNNVNTQQLAFRLKSEQIANIDLDYTNINNYSYFNHEPVTGNIKSTQYDGSINYLRLKLNKELTFGKFALDNTVMYQKVSNGEGVLNVPEIVTRNTFYYSNHLFKKAMFLQTGITLNYFTEYNMNGYDPLLAEFYTQNETKLGGFPRLDVFINAKIRQTRIYLKAEHFNSGFTGYNYYSAPNTPYRDFTVRFGIVWNFFL